MTSSSANLPSSSNAAAAASSSCASPLACLMQALAASGTQASPESGPRVAIASFDSLLAPGAARSPRAVSVSGETQSELPAAALNNAAPASQPGLWAAMLACAPAGEAVPVEPITIDPIDPVDSVDPVDIEEAAPLRSELEAAAAIVLAVVHALPMGQPLAIGDAGSEGAGVADDVAISVEVAGEPEFTVDLPRARQPAAAEALTAAAARIAERTGESNPHAALQSHGARAAQVLTALAAGEIAERTGDSNPHAAPRSHGARAAQVLASLAAGEKPPEAKPQGAAATDVPVAPIEAEIALPTGGTIRIALKPVASRGHAAEADLPEPEAEIAPVAGGAADRPVAPIEALKKTFLSIVDKQLERADRSAGIGVAKSGTDMPEQASPSLPSTPGTPKAPELAAGLTVQAGGFPGEATREPADPVQSVARRAVDTAVNVMEIQAGQRGRNLSTVNVRMKLAGEDLAIRVELRDGEVHTSFHTASADLRAAIGREWQAAAAETPHRILKFHEPEFSNVERNLADRGAAEQQQGRDGQAAREHAQARREFSGSENRFNGRAHAAPVAPAPAAIPAMLAPGSLHLSAFA